MKPVVNFNKLVNIPTSNTNILDKSDETINYIEAFLHDCHSYPVPPTNPIIQFYCPASQEHLTPDIIAEAHAEAAAAATESSPNAVSPDNMSTLIPS